MTKGLTGSASLAGASRLAAVLLTVAACGSRTPLDSTTLTGDDGDAEGMGDSGATDTGAVGTSSPPESGPRCFPAGYACVANTECCGALTCVNSLCGGPTSCLQPGVSCTSDLECCEGSCAAPDDAGGMCCGCGGPAGNCPLGGSTACDACLAQSCCELVGDCETDPQCSSYLQCVLACEGQGSSALECMLQCTVVADVRASALHMCAVEECDLECSGG